MKGAARKGDADDAAVEELLREAQDDVLLKLRLNPHHANVDDADSFLGADLARRFQALKSPTIDRGSKPSKPSSSEGRPSGAGADEESKRILGNDLSARFAALKGAPAPTVQGDTRSMPGIGGSSGDGDGEEKEVERVMQWAVDAARLDPSKSDADDDVEDADDDSDDDDDDVDGDDEKKKKKKVERKPKKRWIFF